ncbi:MAG TPA: CbiQ family ECF transporter T component [Terriglobales bacterium]|nr:CbiQ family ECF transporter T component [Terriglobales bacterium]
MNQQGFFQGLDSRVKVLFLLFFVVVVSLEKNLVPEFLIAFFIFILVAASRLKLVAFYKRVLLFGFLFGFLVALPASLNMITPGDMVLPLVDLGRPYRFWIYSIPATIGITREGITGVAMLTSRVINSIALSFLVIDTTPFAEIIRAMKSMKVPDPFLIVLTLSYKYILLFARTVEDIHLAMKGRLIGVNHAQARQWTASRIGFVFRRTQLRCEEVYRAMLGRGFTGDMALCRLDSIRRIDLLYGALFLLVGLLLLFV